MRRKSPMASASRTLTGMMVTVLLLLTACSSNGGNSGEAASTKKAAESPVETAKEGEPAKEKVKFYYVAQDRKANAPGDQEVVQYINEKFNVDYQRVDIPQDQVNEKMNVMLAAGEQIDAFNVPVFGTDPKAIHSLIANDTIQPLNDYLDKYGQNLLKEVPEEVWKYVTDEDGSIWGIPEMGFKSKLFLFVRKDWMDKLGIEPPKTLEQFEQMLIAFRDGDPDGNGKNDTYPLIDFNSTYISGFMGTFLKHGNSAVEIDGKLVPAFMDPNYKTYVETLARWYKDGLIHPEFMTMKREQALDLIARGVSGVYPSWYTLSNADTVENNNPEAKVDYIPFPVGPSGTSGAWPDLLIRSAFVIHKNTKPEVAERIIEVADWLQTPEGTDFSWYGIANKHFVKEGDKVAPAEGVDPTNPPYKGQYYINAGNSWKYFSESILTVPELTAITRQAAIAGKYPTVDPIDYMYPYNWEGTRSKDLLSDLEGKMPSEMFARIVTGEQPVEWLDQWIEEWKAAGGDTYIEEKSKLYLELKETYGQ